MNARLLALAAVPLAAAAACGGGAEGPETPLRRFVAAINDADFNDAYQQLSFNCTGGLTLDDFEETYGGFFLEAGVGNSGFAMEGELRAEDVSVEQIDDLRAEITLDWVLKSSFDNPLPLLGAIAEQEVPLNTVLDVAGTRDNPLAVVDETRHGDWRLDDCDPLGLEGYQS